MKMQCEDSVKSGCGPRFLFIHSLDCVSVDFQSTYCLPHASSNITMKILLTHRIDRNLNTNAANPSRSFPYILPEILPTSAPRAMGRHQLGKGPARRREEGRRKTPFPPVGSHPQDDATFPGHLGHRVDRMGGGALADGSRRPQAGKYGGRL